MTLSAKTLLAGALLGLAGLLPGAELWQEAEHYARTNWDGVALFLQPDGKGASNHRVLKLYNGKAPADADGYFAEYEIEVPEDGEYHVWASLSDPASSWASPVKIQFDGLPQIDTSGCRWKSGAYGLPHPNRVLGWINPGSVKLTKGRHKVVFRVSEPRRSDRKFISYFDGFYLTTAASVRPPASYRIAPNLQPAWRDVVKRAGSYKQLADSLKYGSEVWREAEDYVRTNWGGKVLLAREDGKGASGSQILRVYTGKAPEGTDGYFAEYRITVPEDGEYHVWLSISDPGSAWASPVRIRFDGQPELDTAGMRWKSRPYGNGQLGWVTPGKVKLTKGEHQVTVRVTDMRRMSKQYICFFDGFYLCTGEFPTLPDNYRIAPNLQPEWKEVLERVGSFRLHLYELEKQQFKAVVDTLAPTEQISDANAELAEKRLMARPLPDPAGRKRPHRFGVHGMEKPFVLAGVMPKETERAFELLARAGVDTLRTAELCWHRLGNDAPPKFDFTEIDYQIQFAQKYGMNFMFTIGYPPGKFNFGGHHLSTFRPEHEKLFREYLRIILPKYDRYAQYWEYCNEVDAPQVWWRKATAREYARDCRIVRDEMKKLGIRTPLLGVSATYSRTDRHDPKGEGRAFTRTAAAAGMADVLDGYSLHYTWPLKQQPFVEFFRDLTPGGASRLLVNSEEAGYTHPSDVIKLFARDFYLYGMESVYYYVSRDWIEAGNPIYSGLFDIDWRPKLRLLSFAAAVDAMKTRELAAMAEPAPGVEAYLLRNPENPADCAVVLWKNGGDEAHGSRFTRTAAPAPVQVAFPAGTIVKAVDWKLDEPAFTPAAPVFEIGAQPLIVYCDRLPEWTPVTPEEWQKTRHAVGVNTSEANLPGQ